MGFTGLTEEVKYEYEPLVLPEGYRFLRNHIDDEGHWALITDAPDPTPDLRLSYDMKFIPRKRIRFTRHVTPWMSDKDWEDFRENFDS